MEFKEWIRKYEKEDSPMGDLAEDIHADKGFPESNDRAVLVSYLHNRGACSEAVSTLRSALNRYNAYIKRTKG